jgi:hypothetical protein
MVFFFKNKIDMKNLVSSFNYGISFVIVLFLAFLMSGCNSDSPLINTSDINSLEENIISGEKSIINPSNDPDPLVKAQEDWDNINEALQNAGPGEVIKLNAGLFYLHKSIITTNFAGTFKGAGEKRTTIQTAPGITFDVSLDLAKYWNNDFVVEGNAMFSFPQDYNTEERNVIISDLKIIVNEPTTPWKRNLNEVDGPTTTHNSLVAITVYYKGLDNDLLNPIALNVDYKNITVQGIEDPQFNSPFGSNYSITTALSADGASSGKLNIKGVEIINSTFCMGLFAWNEENSDISVKESRFTNSFRGIWSQFNNSISIKDNEFENCLFDAIVLIEFSFGESIIKDNQFYNIWGPCVVGVDVNNVNIIDNYFSGNGFSAIFARDGEGWEIKDDDMCDFSPTNPGGATIFLINLTESNIYNNSNQIIGGPSASEPSNNIFGAIECGGE